MRRLYSAVALVVAAGGIYMHQRVFKHFKYSEFADRLSGTNEMKVSTIRRLDKARGFAGVPFRVASGYRDGNHPETIKNPTSSHAKGYAADIAYSTTAERDAIVAGAKKAGFLRIGIGANFVHLDDDPDKKQYVTWYYDGTAQVEGQERFFDV
jgi:hypothetical protein